MRKFTLLTMMLVMGFAGLAQKTTQVPLLNTDVKHKVFNMKQHQSNTFRNVGDTIWYNDLSNASEWSIYNLNGTTYDWVIGTSFPSGPYSSGQTISSTTVSNGFAMFDSDNYGDVTHDACIEYSYTIDCSSLSNVAVVAQQSYRYYSSVSECYVEVSVDGVNWDSYPINTAVASGTTEEEPFKVNISATAANQATVHIRIRWAGNWEYAWMFDDIAVVEGANYDLVGQAWIPTFYGAGWYSVMPKSNHTPLTLFQVPVFNNGAQDLTGLNMTVTIDDETATQVYNETTITTISGSQDLVSSGLDTLYNDVPFDPDTTAVHTYIVNMSIAMIESDESPADNELVTPYLFQITDSTIGRANAIDRWLSTAYYSGTISGDVFGTIVYLPNPDTVSSMDLFLKADAAALANGASVTATLYSVDPGTGAWVEVISSDPYDITAADTASAGHWVNIPYVTDGFSEIISGGGWYLIGLVANYDPASSVVAFGAEQLFPHDFQNSVNLLVGGSTWYYTTSGVPAFYLNMKHAPVATSANTYNQAQVSIYPNPANTEIHIDNASGATIYVYNLTGQNVVTLENANKFNTVNVSDLPAGSYIVKVVNNNDVKTQKINIVK